MKTVLKWAGIGLGALLVLILIVGATLFFRGQSHFTQTHDVTPTLTSVPMDSALVARGEHLARIHACTECHGERLEGRVFVDVPPFRAVAANLTPGAGGIGAAYTDADWDRAIRHGVKPDGRGVLIMPARAYNRLSDADATALIAYLKQVPPVDQVLPATELKALGRVIAGTGGLTLEEFIAPEASRRTAPAPGPTEAYGAYLAHITCAYCHGQDLHGGKSPDPDVPSPGLQAAGAWSTADFITTLRTGVNPGGKHLNPDLMPWRAFRHMTDDELTALHAYLRTLGV